MTEGESDSSSTSDNPLSLRSLSGTNGDGSPVLGSLDASVTVVGFSDFQCPICGIYIKLTKPEIKKEYYVDTGKVTLIFNHFPRLGRLVFSRTFTRVCQRAG